MRLFKQKVTCPYCGNELEKKPTRKKKCPHCSEFIFVRSGELYTEIQVKEFDFKRRWLGILGRFGATEEMFTRQRKDLSKRFGFQASVNDTIWGLMNKLLGVQNDLLDMEQIYLFMGDFVEEEGKDPKQYYQQAMNLKENLIKQDVVNYKKEFGSLFDINILVYTCNDQHICENCDNASKQKYKVDEFLENMPIPMKCENPRGCRCSVHADLV